MTLSISQSAHRRTSRSWAWSVWLEGPAAELDAIRYVTYTLHPTFSEPVQRVDERDTGFRLDSHGWGEFRIHVQVQRKDSTQEELSHWLQLSDNAGAALTRGHLAMAPQHAQVCLFLSSIAADAPIAEKLSEVLRGQGIEVARAEDVPAGAVWSEWVDEQMRRANALLLLLTRRFDSRQLREVEQFRAMEKRVLALVVYGHWSPITLTPDLQQLKPLPVKWDENHVAEAAAEISRRIREVLEYDQG